jgi:DNA-binding response OmpR family regulator
MPASVRLDIAITDRNPHVREFLCRELSGEGHRVGALAGASQLLEGLHGGHPPQVLVLDPEAAGAHLGEVVAGLKLRPEVLVLLHVFEGEGQQQGFEGAFVVEKQPDIGALKAAIRALAAQFAGREPGHAQQREKP